MGLEGTRSFPLDLCPFEIIFRVFEAGIDCQRFLAGVNGSFELSQIQVGRAYVVVCQGTVGIDSQGALSKCDTLAELSRLVISEAQLKIAGQRRAHLRYRSGESQLGSSRRFADALQQFDFGAARHKAQQERHPGQAKEQLATSAFQRFVPAAEDGRRRQRRRPKLPSVKSQSSGRSTAKSFFQAGGPYSKLT